MKILRDRSTSLMKSTIGTAGLFELRSSSWQKPIMKTADSLGVAFGTNTGSRSRNEDRFVVARVNTCIGRKFSVALVCDGVGGSEMGDAAAALAIAAFLEKLAATDTNVEINQLLVELIKYADVKVREEFNGRGATTLSVILISSEGEIAASNIGDSRIYAWSPGTHLDQISVDDTIENELKNFLMPDDAALAFHHMRGGLSQAIGEIGRDENDLRITALDANQFSHGVILATDGAWKSDELAFNLVAINAENPQDAVRRIISLSAWTGAVDNVSLVAIGDLRKFANGDDFPPNYGPSKATLVGWFGENKIFISENFAKPRPLKKNTLIESHYTNDEALKVSVRRQLRKKQKDLNLSSSSIDDDRQLSFSEKSENNERPLHERVSIEVSTDERSSKDK